MHEVFMMNFKITTTYLKRYALGSFFLLFFLIPTVETKAHDAHQNQPFIHKQSGYITASLLIEKEPHQLWKTIIDYQKMGEIMPDVKKIQVIKRDGSRTLVKYSFFAPYTFGRTIDAVIQIDNQSNFLLNYKLIKSQNINSLYGHWILIPFDGHTLVSHRVYIEPKIPLFLKTLFFKYFENNLKKSMTLIAR